MTMTTGERIKATEQEYRGLWIYQLTDGRYGVSGFPVDADDLRDGRFAPIPTLDAAKAECDAFRGA